MQLYVTIQLSVNTVSKNSSISNNSVKHKHAVYKCKYGLIVKKRFYFKLFSLLQFILA